MIFRRKPFSDEREFNDEPPPHLYEGVFSGPKLASSTDGPHGERRLNPGVVRHSFALGGESASGRLRMSDCAVDIDWQDIVRMIEWLAQHGYPPAVEAAQRLEIPILVDFNDTKSATKAGGGRRSSG